MLTSQYLQKIKTNALRRKVWFKALTRVERSVIDLTIQCVKRVQSRALAKAILTIIAKFERALREKYLNQAEKIGRTLAHEICELASKWGNRQASTWKHDLNFIRLLGINALNT